LANLFAAKEQGMGLAALWNRLPARFGRAGLIDDVPVAVSRALLTRLVPSGSTIEVELDNAGQEKAPAGWRECKATLARFFTPLLGFDDIVRINVLDGVRITFKNGDVAHLRPSGNAPQLRIYANSDSQDRADQIVELGLREPDGILRLMQRALS
jgi:phosphomannomutase